MLEQMKNDFKTLAEVSNPIRQRLQPLSPATTSSGTSVIKLFYP